MEAQQIKTIVERALISYSGTTTGDGAAGGTTLVCSALTALPDYNRLSVLIAEGTYAGLTADINGTTTGGTINVEPAFGGVIVSGINFHIIPRLPAYSELVDIMGTGFDTATDSLVKLHDDHVTHITADYGATEKAAIDLLDDAGYGLAALDTELGLIPQSGGTTTWNATALASINAEVDGALNTAIPGSPVAGSINERIKALDDAYTAAKAVFLDVAISTRATPAQVNTEVDNALNTVIPGSPTANSINERIKALDDAYTATRGGYLDELGPTNIPADTDPKVMGRSQIFEKSITSAANAGDVNVATITDHPCLIESVVIHADAAQTGDLTSCGVFGGAGKVITFVSAADAVQANLDAEDKQVAWEGAVRLAATKTIVISLVGGAATAVDLTIVIKYRACVSGGYLV